MARGVPPSENSRVLMIMGPSNIVNEEVLRTTICSQNIHVSLQNHCWGDDGSNDTNSIVYSFSSVTLSERAWITIAHRIRHALLGIGSWREEGWGRVHLTYMPDPCEPVLEGAPRRRRHST